MPTFVRGRTLISLIGMFLEDGHFICVLCFDAISLHNDLILLQSTEPRCVISEECKMETQTTKILGPDPPFISLNS